VGVGGLVCVWCGFVGCLFFVLVFGEVLGLFGVVFSVGVGFVVLVVFFWGYGFLWVVCVFFFFFICFCLFFFIGGFMWCVV